MSAPAKGEGEAWKEAVVREIMELTVKMQNKLEHSGPQLEEMQTRLTGLLGSLREASRRQQSSAASNLQPKDGERTALDDPEKRKMIQQQLLLFLHAHNCQRRENQANGEQRQCNLPHCQTMKNVLNHMSTCQAGRNCTVPHCASSRQIIGHWKNCKRSDCPVCVPLKQAEKNWHSSTGAAAAQPNNQLGPSLPDLRKVYGDLHKAAPPAMQPGQIAAMANVRLAQSDAPGLEAGAAAVGGQSTPTDADVGGVWTVGNQDSVSAAAAVANIKQQLIGFGEAGQPAGLDNKEWRHTVTSELRNFLVYKLVYAIFPTPDPQAMLDKRMNNLVLYARKVEGDIYKTAHSRPEYYNRVAQKIYQIQIELEEKRKKRKEQYERQLQLQAQRQ